ncbi:hypothetical protein [Lentiprolixibacter aurantiacus]|uniref:Uncharacterized protein n=1 Tax=Lentiprolixibacter aurantiacus TaxID=2993939 RepID=A0AAE3SN28_9FLAO|nr:hypothetical protein [Lentiprolixibacter aurantiacus]MCX2718921.1 hypothetical protein [Lentiprolixibacter aurantiacus]
MKLDYNNKTILSRGLLEKSLQHYHDSKSLEYVVNPSLPIVFFGDISSYHNQNFKVITVGKNPSNREFQLYSERYSYIRFPKFNDDPISLETSLNDYFKVQPYRRWFDSFEPFLNGLNGSYYPENNLNKVLHTDICSPISTDPTWSLLSSNQQSYLFNKGFKLWKEIVLELKPNLIVFSIPKRYVHLLNSKKVETLHTITHKKDGTLRTKPYDLELYEVEIHGFNTYLVYGESKNTPMGSVSTQDKILMGEKCFKFFEDRNFT